MSENNSFGPVWTINSDEAAGAFFIGFIIIALPVAPLAYLGYYIGNDIIQMNIVKWGLGILFFGLGYLIIMILSAKKFYYAFLFVAMEYFLVDIVWSNHTGRDELVTISLLKEFIAWALSNT